MNLPSNIRPRWRSRKAQIEHFKNHGTALGVSTVEQYDERARDTIALGKEFTYRDKGSKQMRRGYYASESQRFTALTWDYRYIVTHFSCDEFYVKYDLWNSTYR